MKLITLNIWGGHVHEQLRAFIKQHADTDIFCFQEIYKMAAHKISTDDRWVNLDSFSEFEDLLPNHTGFFRPVVNNAYGIALFIKNEFTFLGEGEICIHNAPDYSGMGAAHSRNLQWIRVQSNSKTYTIMNVHGLWNGLGKADSPDRIDQSVNIRNFMDAQDTPIILCGDFNARPDTKSIALLAHEMNNLIQTHNITSTRTTLYPKEEQFADYVFTSPDIKVHTFEVLHDVVSDHAPLMLDFD